jgi:hypothetical protein
VPEVVEPDDRQAGVVGELLEVPGDVLGSQRPSVLAGEDRARCVVSSDAAVPGAVRGVNCSASATS